VPDGAFFIDDIIITRKGSGNHQAKRRKEGKT
jgi:hypothetical protein